MRPIKTLQLATSFVRFKGEDGFTIEYAKRLARKGISLDVVAPHDRKKSKGFEELYGVRVHRFQYFFPKSLQRLAYNGGIAFNFSTSLLAKFQLPFFTASFFFKALRNMPGKDLVHGQWVPSGLIAVILKRLFHKPVVFWVHRMNYGNWIMRGITRLVLENSDFVMFNSSYTLGLARKIARMERFEVVPPAVDLSVFKPLPRKSFRRRFGISPKKRIVFAVGRMVEKKGFRYLIEAIPLLNQKDVVCVIGGTGPLQDDLKRLVRRLGLQEKVLFPGWIANNELPLWMNEADVIVVPSIVDRNRDTETLGIVAVEGIACGKPVIASRVGGLVDVVKHNFNGFLVKQKSPKELASKLALLLKDKRLCKKLSANARKHAEQNYSWNRTVDRTIEVYKELLGKA